MQEEDFIRVKERMESLFYDCPDEDSELLMAIAMIKAGYEMVERKHGRQKLFELHTFLMMRNIDEDER